MNLKEKKERRLALHEEMKALHKAENLDIEKFDKLDAEFKTLDKEIQADERMTDIDKSFKVTEPQKILNDRDSVNEAYRQFIRYGTVDKVDASIRANVQSTTDSLGGYTIPTGFSNALEKAAAFYSDIPSFASSFVTGTGNDLVYPTVNDTSNVAYQVAEAGDLTTSATAATFGSTTFKAWKWHTGMLKLNYELFEDSYFNFETLLADLFAERKGRGENAAMTTGAGTTTIAGYVTGSTLGVTAAATGAVTRDEILELIHSLDPAYRKSPNCRISMSDATLAAIRKLDYGTADARPLYQPSAIAGEPDMIEGIKIFINNDIDDMAASKKSIIIGDFSKYKIRRVGGLRFKTVYELYAATDQIGMDLLWRWDAQVLDAGTHPFKHLIMHA